MDRYELLPECDDDSNPAVCLYANDVTCLDAFFQIICGRTCCQEVQQAVLGIDNIHECGWITKVGAEGNPLAYPDTFHDGSATGWDSSNDQTRIEWTDYVEDNAVRYLDPDRTAGLGPYSWGVCTAFDSRTLDFERDSYLANDFLQRFVHGCTMQLPDLEIGYIEEILAEPCLSGRTGNISDDTSRTHCLAQVRDRAREIRVLNQNFGRQWDCDADCTEGPCFSDAQRGEDVWDLTVPYDATVVVNLVFDQEMSLGLVDTVAFVDVTGGVAQGTTLTGDVVVDIATCETFTQTVAVQAGSSITIYLSACDREAEHDPNAVQRLWVEARCTPAPTSSPTPSEPTRNPTSAAPTSGPTPAPSPLPTSSPTFAGRDVVVNGYTCSITPGGRLRSCSETSPGSGEATLNLFENQITSIMPDAFAGLSNVTVFTTLKLRSNQISSITADLNAFVGLSGLTILILYENQISIIMPDTFAGLSSLRTLNIRDNQISSISADAFVGLSSLTRLDLRENQISSIVADTFTGLSSLLRLYLNSNQISGIVAGTFAGLSSLTHLVLNNNQISGILAGTFAGLSSLTTLHVNGNPTVNISCDWGIDTAVTTDIQLPDGHTLDSICN